VSERLPLTRIAEIEQHLVATTNWSLGNLAARDLLAELYAVRAELRIARDERDAYRERALDAENRSIVDGREVCADCARPVPDGPCGVHSPDAVFQRAAREAAQLRAERDQAREKALREAASHFDRMADREPDPHGYRARVMRGAANDIRRFAVATAPTAGES
jgi:hypothetical protein